MMQGDVLASPSLFDQGNAFHNSQALRAESMPAEQGGRSASWPAGSTVQQRMHPPDLYGMDELSEPPLQFRSGPAADFWNARQEGPDR